MVLVNIPDEKETFGEKTFPGFAPIFAPNLDFGEDERRLEKTAPALVGDGAGEGLRLLRLEPKELARVPHPFCPAPFGFFFFGGGTRVTTT